MRSIFYQYNLFCVIKYYADLISDCSTANTNYYCFSLQKPKVGMLRIQNQPMRALYFALTDLSQVLKQSFFEQPSL